MQFLHLDCFKPLIVVTVLLSGSPIPLLLGFSSFNDGLQDGQGAHDPDRASRHAVSLGHGGHNLNRAKKSPSLWWTEKDWERKCFLPTATTDLDCRQPCTFYSEVERGLPCSEWTWKPVFLSSWASSSGPDSCSSDLHLVSYSKICCISFLLELGGIPSCCS